MVSEGVRTLYIRRFTVKNYMIHRDTFLDLHPITVLVGDNNGGKSALFDALLNFSMVSRGKLSQAFGPGPYSFTIRKHRGSAAAARISFEALLSRSNEESEQLSYLVSYAQTPGSMDHPRYTIYDEKIERVDTSNVLFDRSDVDASPMTSVLSHLTEERSIFAAIRRAQVAGDYEEVDPLVTYCAREVSRIGKFRLDPLVLAKPSPLPDPSLDPPEYSRTPRLDYRGEGLAGVLYHLAETDSEILAQITDKLRTVLDGFDSFDYNVVEPDRVTFSAVFSDPRGTVSAANLSHGTLSLIGLTVLLLSPSRPPVICIEEPENGLTPRSVRSLYETMHSLAFAANTDERSQVLVSSHSPFVITQAWNGEDRDFIYQMKPQEGSALVRSFAQVIEDQGVQLRKEKG